MNIDVLKLSYSPNQFRMRISFPFAACLVWDSPPEAVLSRIKVKFETEKAAGNFDMFEVYDKEFSDYWKMLSSKLQNGYVPGTSETVFTLGCGAPRIDGIEVEKSDDPKIAFLLSMTASSQEARAWKFDFIKLNLHRELARISLDASINYAHVYSSWMRLCRGENVFGRAVGFAPEPVSDAKLYSLIVNKLRGEISLVIYSADIYRDTAALETLVQSCDEASKRLSVQTSRKTEFLRTQLIDRLKSSRKGPESHGFGLPAVYLVAYPQEAQSDQVRTKQVTVSTINAAPIKASTPTEAAPPPAVVPAAPAAPVFQSSGLLKVKVEADQMAATIEGFELKLYDHPEISVSVEWIRKELAAAGIVFNSDESIDSNLALAIERGENLNGKLVAKGLAPLGAKEPFIHHSFKEIDPSVLNQTLDIREMQQRSIVNEGDIIAEIRYKKNSAKGKTIYGRELPELPAEELAFTVGEGVDQRGRKFFALKDGLPKIENNLITLSRALLHKGDVNLRSGNIRFDGAAEITGSIDSGSTVEVSGDLIVHGTILSSFVRVGGNLEVRSGIVTGEKGMVRVAHDINVEFIEHSRIICGGNVSIRKACLNSDVVAGGNIQTVDKAGVIGGGNYSCRKNLQAGKLGFQVGARTNVSTGINWRAKLSFDIRRNRMERIIKAAESDRASLRELSRKKDHQRTKKHDELLVELQARSTKMRAILERCKTHLESAQKNITFDSESRIYVLDILYSNVTLEVAGVAIPVTQNIAEVMVAPKRIRGSFIVALVDAEAEKQAS